MTQSVQFSTVDAGPLAASELLTQLHELLTYTDQHAQVLNAQDHHIRALNAAFPEQWLARIIYTDS